MIILGIETSCDETALSLLETRNEGGLFECRVIASLIHSQAELHSAYGGVFPSLAKREHGTNLVPLLHKLFIEAELKSGPHETRYDELMAQFREQVAPQNPELFETFAAADFLRTKPAIDAIAVTEGPGLEPALWVGITFARMLGELWGIPGECVSRLTNANVSCDTPDSRYVPAFVIPFDETLGRVSLDGTTYLVKWLDREIRFARKEISVCQTAGLTLPDGLTLPSASDLRNPSDPASPVYIGAKPEVTAAPRVIHGEVKY